MIFDALNELYDFLSSDPREQTIPHLGWQSERVSYALEINYEGELIGIRTLIENKTPKSMFVPEKGVKASGIKASFLSDNSQYVLGLSGKENDKRVQKCYDASKELHLEILDTIDSPIAKAICKYYSTWDISKLKNSDLINQYKGEIISGTIVFLIENEYAHDDPIIKDAWEKYYSIKNQGPSVLCFDSGKIEPAKIIHGKIKGIIDGHTAGTSLISFQKGSSAFESYGKKDKQGLTAPISDRTSFAYVTTLNYLLSAKEHHCSINGQSLVYWGEKHTEKAMGAFVVRGESGDEYIKNIMEIVAKGHLPQGIDPNKKFHIIAFKANAARLSVSFYWQNTVSFLYKNIKKHYDDIEITKAPYEREYLSIRDIFDEIKNPKNKSNLSANLVNRMFEAVFNGTKYPDTLYYSVLRRIKADRVINRGRVSIIKAFLKRNRSYTKGVLLDVSLDENNNNPAYVLGRLFSILEDIQEKAHAEGKKGSGLNRTIKDRFFTLASNTPNSAFSRLMTLSDHHINKLKRFNPGQAAYYEIQKGKLLDKLSASDGIFPAHFSLVEQGMFIGGYYHQTQERYRKKETSNKEVAEV